MATTHSSTVTLSSCTAEGRPSGPATAPPPLPVGGTHPAGCGWGDGRRTAHRDRSPRNGRQHRRRGREQCSGRWSIPDRSHELGDTRFIDASDPTAPVELADWDNRRDGRAVIGEYDEEEIHAHSVSLSSVGLAAWLSHWDAGTILLDLVDPARPKFVGAVGFIPDGEGNRHSSAFDETNALLIVNEEDFYPTEDDAHTKGWGTQHIYDVSDPRNPVDSRIRHSTIQRRRGRWSRARWHLLDSRHRHEWVSGNLFVVFGRSPDRGPVRSDSAD